MVSIEITSEINRPQQEIFDFISDPANDHLYRKGAQSAEWTNEDSVGIGSTMRTVDRVMGREVVTMSEITVCNPPHKYAFMTVGGSYPSSIMLEFEPVEGGTRVTSRTEIEFRGVFRVFEILFRKQIVNQGRDDFDRLKHLIEEG